MLSPVISLVISSGLILFIVLILFIILMRNEHLIMRFAYVEHKHRQFLFHTRDSLWQSVTPLIKRKDLVEGILLRRLFIWFRTLSRRNSCDSSLMILMIRKLHSTNLSHELWKTTSLGHSSRPPHCPVNSIPKDFPQSKIIAQASSALNACPLANMLVCISSRA